MKIHPSSKLIVFSGLAFVLLAGTSGCRPADPARTKPALADIPTLTPAEVRTALPTAAQPLTPTPTQSAPTLDASRLIEQAQWGKGAVEGGEYSPDGKRLGLFTSQGTYIYDAENLKQLDLIPGGSAVPVAAFSPDWSLLAVGSDADITILRIADKSQLAQLKTDQGEVIKVLFSPDGHSLVGLVRPPGEEVYTYILDLWSIPEGKLVRTWAAGTFVDVAFSPDSHSVYAWNWASRDEISRWEIPSGLPLPVVRDGIPTTRAASPDGKWTASATLSSDTLIITLRRAADGVQVLKLDWEQAWLASNLFFSPDSSRLVAVKNESYVKVWKIPDGSLVSAFQTGGSSSPFQLISPDGQNLVVEEAIGLAFYSLSSGQIVRRLDGHMGPVIQAAWSPQGDRVAGLVSSGVQTNTSLAVWFYPQGRLSYLLPGVNVLQFAWSPNGDRLALAGLDGQIRVLDSSDGSLIQTLQGHPPQVQSVAWSPDGTEIASSSFSVKVWRVSDGTLVSDLGGSGQWINSLHFSPDGKLLAGSDADGKIDIWRLADKKLIAQLAVQAYGDSNVIEFAPDGSYLAAAEQSRLSVWHMGEDKPFLQLPAAAAGVVTLGISPDGGLLAGGLTDGTVQLWQIPQGRLGRTLKVGSAGISSLEFSKDGKPLLAASRDGTIHFWEVKK